MLDIITYLTDIVYMTDRITCSQDADLKLLEQMQVCHEHALNKFKLCEEQTHLARADFEKAHR